ncbi:hypothetical protein [Schlesneria sp.]|uniref:hypothetical protein n=1 Tax=Schlesneria sp. TaxID=2762018 RepID=UPI002F11A098
MNKLPEQWQSIDQQTLTSTEQRTLFLLTAAGLVERQLKFRVASVLGTFAADVEVVATGEFGFVQALQPVITQMWSASRDEYERWMKEHGDFPTFPFELVVEFWRLTDQGVIAKQDLATGVHDRLYVFDYVLKRGSCVDRPPDKGRGRLLKMTRTDGSTSETSSSDLPQVAVANWDAGCEVFAQRFSSMLAEAMAAKQMEPPSILPVVSFEPCQVQIGTECYALKEDAAHLLHTLILHYGERMSDPEIVSASEFLKITYLERPRLQSVRNSIPAPVKTWLDTNNGGTKLRRPV